ncbi:MAG TPA: ADYC domain-containing protein [Polyangiaceae bacterium]|nr:ADYC domain-containing protein [Polyangiaceae bacterium]
MLGLAVASILLLACAPEGEVDGEGWPDAGEAAEVPGDARLGPEGISTNGISTNGISTNGISTNGIPINNQTLEGVALGGATLGAQALGGVTLTATVFSATLPDGGALSGDQIVGASFLGELTNGNTKKLRVDARVQLSGAGAGLSAYEVTYNTSSGRKHLCGLDASGQPVLAVPVMGTWNYGQGVPGGGAFTPSATHFTFACRGAAIAKCVELGYRPWQAAPGGGTLQNHLAACTRALRADYCGDGTSWTVDGTTINLYDAAGVQADTESWGFEAEWTANGARFITGGSGARYTLVGGATPPCLSTLLSPSAGNAAHFSSGTLLMTEYVH